MLVIRLQRTGRKNDPTYRIVLTEKTAPPKSGEIEILGHYLPARKPSVFSCSKERIDYWTGKGAQVSDTVARLLKKEGVGDMERFIAPYAKRKSKSAEEAQPPAAPSAPAADAAPAPSETPPPAQETAPPQETGDTAEKKE